MRASALSIAAREAADLVRCAVVLRYRDARDARLAQTGVLALISIVVVAFGIRLGLREIPLAALQTAAREAMGRQAGDIDVDLVEGIAAVAISAESVRA